MNASLTFRREEGPLFRLKAPVRAVVFPLAVGATYSLQDGTALRVGSTLPWGLAWRLQFWPWGPQPASVMLKYPLHVLGGGLHLGAEVELSTGATRLMLRAKPRLGAFSLGQQLSPVASAGLALGAKGSRVSSARPGTGLSPRAECTLHVHSAVPLGTCQWAQLRWEIAAPADALVSPGWPTVTGPGGSSALGRLSTPQLSPSWPDRNARPWLRLRLGKISFLRMPDRAAARQGLCAACMRAPVVREQTPSVRGGLSPQGLAAAYARTRLEDCAPQLKALRRDVLTDLKAVTLALWMNESQGGSARLASHHCNYSRLPWRDDLAGVATPVRYKGPDGRGTFASFDSPGDFITGFWRILSKHSALATTGWEAKLDGATGSDAACAAFLDTLAQVGVVPVGHAPQVAELVPEARRLLAQGRG